MRITSCTEPKKNIASHADTPLLRKRARTWFLLALGLLTALFLLLLICGNTGTQSDIVYLGGADSMADALKTEAYSRTLNPYSFDPNYTHRPFKDANYPPLAYVLYWLLDCLSLHDVTTPWAMTVAVTLTALALPLLICGCYGLLKEPKSGRAWLLSAMIALSAPTVYAFERGNIILLTVLLCIVYLLWYDSPRRVCREFAFVALAIAAALKIYPALLGLLLLRQKRFAEALRLMLYGALAVFLPFLCLTGGFGNLPLLIENFGAHSEFYTLRIYPRFGSRLLPSLMYYAPFASDFLKNNLWKLGEKLLAVLPYLDALLVIGCAGCALLSRRLFESVLAIMLILVNYPVNSGYYTALYLLPALAMLLQSDELRRRDLWTLFLLVAILSPLQLPMPNRLFGFSEDFLCNFTYLVRNFAAYALFVLFALRGYALAVAAAKSRIGRKKAPSDAHACRPS